MAAYDLEEQEQLSAMKAWWEKHGNLVSYIAAGLAVVVLGWQGWNMYQQRRTAEASGLLSAVNVALDTGDAAGARQAAGKLFADFPGTLQADLGALLMAQADLDGKDAKAAKAKLQQVVDKAGDSLMRDVAALRLAALQLDEKAYDDALKTLEKSSEPFRARFADLRGDVLYAKGDLPRARDAYKEAFEAAKQTDSQTLRGAVELKLEALGGA